jgi:hypothetical protein
MEYKIETSGFGAKQILSRKLGIYDWKVEALVNTDNVERILAAIKLFDTLEEQFASFLKVSPSLVVMEPEEKFDEYVGLGSSWILKLSYAPQTGTFKITKNDGEVITHYNVSQRDFVKVLRPGPESAYSSGKAYNLFIKAVYPTAR